MVDVIPVDLVVAAIVAVAAAGPDPSGATVYQVASSVRNPLRYGQLVDLVQSWFTEHPLYDGDGQPIVVPEWSFPGRGRVQRQLRRATTAFGVAERVLAVLPVRGERADLAARIEDQRTRAERALGYVELYGAYTETEAHFRIDRLLTLWERLSPAEQQVFCFDPAVIRWHHYVHDVHLPSVVEHARVRSTPAKSTMVSRTKRAESAILSPDRHLAAFDLENTLIASNVVESYAWLASRHLPAGERVTFTARLLREAPALLALDRRDRGDFLRSFYRRYDGASAELLRDDSWELFHHMLLTKSFPAGFARVRAHRALGHRTVLITGALDFVVEPLRPLFDEVVCASLGVDPAGRFTGRLERRPPTGEARALVLARVRGGRRPRPRRVRGLCRLDIGPAPARMRRVPRGRQPRSPAGGGGPAPGLARGALGQSRRRRRSARSARRTARPRGLALVDALRGDARLPDRRERVAGELVAGERVAGERDVQERDGGEDGAMKGLVVERSLPRFAAARLVSSLGGSGTRRGGRAPAADRRRRTGAAGSEVARVRPLLAGICGSDLATLDGRSSRYFEDIVSFPFVPGHEVVGVVEDDGAGSDDTGGGLPAGTRVVVEPVLGCIPRGIDPPCAACAEGRVGRVRAGRLRPSRAGTADRLLRRHRGGLVAGRARRPRHPAPRRARCAVRRRRRDGRTRRLRRHAALAAGVEPGDTVAVLGGGHRGSLHHGRPAPAGHARCPSGGGEVRAPT